MGLGPLVLSATTSPHVTYATCCNYPFNLESVFHLHHAKLHETIGRTQGKQFRQQHVCDFLSSEKNTIEVLGEGIPSAYNMVKPFGGRGSAPVPAGGAHSPRSPS